jgi:hypothetical protein
MARAGLDSGAILAGATTNPRLPGSSDKIKNEPNQEPMHSDFEPHT